MDSLSQNSEKTKTDEQNEPQACDRPEDKPMARPDVKSMTLAELTAFLTGMGEKAFRAGQLYEWMHKHLARSYEEMHNLGKTLIGKLEENTDYVALHPVEVLTSAEDGTKKFLFELEDGNIIESVWMQYKHGNSVCISSQVGCRMGCRFCASTLDGLVRNLRPSEMLDQIYAITKLTGERVSNVVVMGSGEPLDNTDNILRFTELLTCENGLNISERNLTISTCGLVDQIRRLADLRPQFTLALSLHAPNQEKRKALMPIANRYEIHETVEAMKYFFDKTGRRITFEYSLVAGQNDSPEDAKELAALIEGLNCHVNLIPVNPIKERDYRESTRERVLAFKNKLEKYGVNVTIRREMGRDINGACGQLRRSFIENR